MGKDLKTKVEHYLNRARGPYSEGGVGGGREEQNLPLIYILWSSTGFIIDLLSTTAESSGSLWKQCNSHLDKTE